jgi:site-specific recombinase XerD
LRGFPTIPDLDGDVCEHRWVMTSDEGLVERYLSYMEGPRRASPHTVMAYRSDLEDLLGFCRRMSRRIADVDHPMLRAYLANLDTRGMSRATIKRRASVVRRFYRFCEREGLVSSNPAELLVLPKARPRLPRVLKQVEVGRVLGLAEEQTEVEEPTPESWRDLALLEVLYDAGLRAGEACALRIADLDLEKGWVRVEQGKGGRDRVVPLAEPAVVAIRAYVSRGRDALLGRGDGSPRTLFLNKLGRPMTTRDTSTCRSPEVRSAFTVVVSFSPRAETHVYHSRSLRDRGRGWRRCSRCARLILPVSSDLPRGFRL